MAVTVLNNGDAIEGYVKEFYLLDENSGMEYNILKGYLHNYIRWYYYYIDCNYLCPTPFENYYGKFKLIKR